MVKKIRCRCGNLDSFQYGWFDQERTQPAIICPDCDPQGWVIHKLNGGHLPQYVWDELITIIKMYEEGAL